MAIQIGELTKAEKILLLTSALHVELDYWMERIAAINATKEQGNGIPFIQDMVSRCSVHVERINAVLALTSNPPPDGATGG